jgi:nucleotide-binding universal stress UspA family protein
MYEKILVPLDGSQQSECILDQVAMLVRGCNIPKVVLLQVIAPFPRPASDYLGGETAREVQKKSLAAAKAYLSDAGDSLQTLSGGVETVVIEGDPTREIIDYAKNHGIDLIAMSTHGASGIANWAMGSVTRRVMDGWNGPLLVMPPAGCRL